MANGRKPCVYISGPMQGIPNENRYLFNKANVRLTELGCDTINPVHICEDIKIHKPNAGIRQFLASDLYALCIHADAMVIIGKEIDVKYSKGVAAEMHTAYRLDIPVFSYTQRSGRANQQEGDGSFKEDEWSISGSIYGLNFPEWLRITMARGESP